jgi:hypothetical protein
LHLFSHPCYMQFILIAYWHEHSTGKRQDVIGSPFSLEERPPEIVISPFFTRAFHLGPSTGSAPGSLSVAKHSFTDTCFVLSPKPEFFQRMPGRDPRSVQATPQPCWRMG